MHFRILKMITSSGYLTALECTKFDFGWGSATDPIGGAYSAPPDPLAGLRGLLLRGGEETGKEGKEGRENVGEGQGTGEWKGWGRDARERGGKGREREEEGEEGREGAGKKSKNTPPSIPAYAHVSDVQLWEIKCILKTVLLNNDPN